ncbi:hypothetical protein Tco_0879503 [Tanacetum coccineum]
MVEFPELGIINITTIRTREGNRSICHLRVDIITLLPVVLIPSSARNKSISSIRESINATGNEYGVDIDRQYNIGLETLPEDRMSSPNGELIGKRWNLEESIEMSRFSMDSTRSDSASKESIPGGIEWMLSSTSS